MLALVALEQDQPVKLVLRFYEMNGNNTSGIGSILTQNHLESIPEAHCYLAYENCRYDFTRLQNPIKLQIKILYEEEITPEQISEYKPQRHKEFIEDWSKSKSLSMNLKTLWEIREACITSLSC